MFFNSLIPINHDNPLYSLLSNSTLNSMNPIWSNYLKVFKNQMHHMKTIWICNLVRACSIQLIRDRLFELSAEFAILKSKIKFVALHIWVFESVYVYYVISVGILRLEYKKCLWNSSIRKMCVCVVPWGISLRRVFVIL